MAKFTSKPEWGAHGLEPPAALKNQGFTAGYKPPADYFNWLFYQICLAITELKAASNSSDGNCAQLWTSVQKNAGDIVDLGERVDNFKQQSDAHIDSEVERLLQVEKTVYGLPLTVLFDENKVPLKVMASNQFSAGAFAPFEEETAIIFISANVSSISGGAFYACRNLTDVYIDRDNNFNISSSAFPDGVNLHFDATFNTTEFLVSALA